MSQQTASIAGEWIARVDLSSQPALLRITLADSGTVAAVSLPFALLSGNSAEARRISDSWRGARVAIAGAAWSFDAGAAPNSLHVEVQNAGDSAMARGV